MTNKLNGQMNIYNIIKKEKLDVVNKPISKAHGYLTNATIVLNIQK